MTASGRQAPPDQGFIALQEALAGRYSLERELGRGGMGIVYLAREVRLDRLVAIKVLPPSLAARPELRARFLREATTAAQLSHPNVVPIFNVDEQGEFVFFVMALVDGETLGERVRARGPLPPHETARVLREAAWALAYAHARGIVHRDVKPDNIMLERGGRVLVMDFGIAHVGADAAITGEGLVMGSAHFMSPEQAAGEPVDGRSDLYSLGVVGWFALTGHLPFDAPDARALLAMHLTRPAPPVATKAPGVPRVVAQAIDRCLAKDPAARFPTGEALAEAIDLSAQRAPDIPAPLRVWLSSADRMRIPMAVAGVYATGGALGIAASGLPFLAPLPLLAAGAAFTAARLLQARRVLAAGYDADDFRAAVEQHVVRRREELDFEYSQWPGRIGRAMRIASYIGAGAGALFAMFPTPETAGLGQILLGVSGGAFIGGTVASVGQQVRARLRGRYGAWALRFWNSPRAARFLKLAGWKVDRRGAPARVMPQATEIALGRATDNLFEALPKPQQKLLGGLPETVRRLEADGRKLRVAMDAIDASLVAVESGAPTPSRPNVAGLEARRLEVVTELRDRRGALAEQHAQLVASLEGIRLDLLRLHGGAVGVESVTATLEAADRLGVEVAALAAGKAEVDRLLRP